MLNEFVEKRILLIISIIIMNLAAVGQNTDQVQLASQYYQNGEFLKARDIYDQLVKSTSNFLAIHNNYFNILMDQQDFRTADKYLKRAIKAYPQNVYFKVDRAIMYQTQGDSDKYNEFIKQLTADFQKSGYQASVGAQYMLSKQLTTEALGVYKASRRFTGDESKYALEMANAYRQLDQKDLMIQEYLNFAALRPSNLRYVKNILQTILQEEEDIQSFQQILIDKIQKNPSESMYGDLLIWVNIQQKNFYAAFIQAKALDKKFKEEGTRLMHIGELAVENGAYDDAIEIYTYVIDKYPKNRIYATARSKRIGAREEKVKSEYPVDKNAIRQLTLEYMQLVQQLGLNNTTNQAYRGKAILHAFYLHEYDTAITILQELINQPRIDGTIRAKSKLDLGDIYLLTDEPWEATLLYSQVEKENKSSALSYEAKLRNAKLNYYIGNFELAKSHLDILKESTTKEIANDAMALSLLIKDNTLMDSSDFVMKQYATAELLVYQNKITEAKAKFNTMLTQYATHSIVDEIYWQLANIEMRAGKFQDAVDHLETIRLRYAQDIWGDDAHFLMADIYEKQLKQPEKAMEIYRDFLTTYPGSVYISEARKRFRKLRGDSI